MLEITHAEYISDYKIALVFNTKENGTVDLFSSLWGPVFEVLKNPDEFKKFKLSPVFKTIVWENGADFAPEYLYELMKSQNMLHYSEESPLKV